MKHVALKPDMQTAHKVYVEWGHFFLFIACSITTVILHAVLLYYYTAFLHVLYNCICN
jgi:hypothetical protein